MKLSFLPAKLILEKDAGGLYRLEIDGRLVATFAREKPALKEYNRLRIELGSQFPAVEITDDDKRKLLQQNIIDGLIGHNSLRTPAKKAPKTRTFG